MNRELIRTGYSGTTLLVAFAAGALIGAAAALLLAPAPGAETRRRVRERAREAAHVPGDVARRVADAVHRGKVEDREPLADAYVAAAR